MRRYQAEYEELQPIIQQVVEFKDRQRNLQSLLSDLVERPKLFQATEAVLTALEPDVSLERLEVRGLDVRILGRAEDEQAVERFIASLQTNGGFEEVGQSDEAADDAPVPPRFVVEGELRIPWPGVDE